MLTIGKAAQITLAIALPTSIVLLYYWYKSKSDDESAYGKRKQVTSRNTVIEVKIPQHAVGAVIGKQGSMIKQIVKETGAALHFQNKGNGDLGSDDASNQTHRILVIRGTPEAAHQAELMAYQVIASLSNILTEEIEVPEYAIGRIIGKGGGTIKDITAVSEARIKIDRETGLLDKNHPRIITLSGSRKQIDIAMKLIQVKLDEEEQFRSKQSYSKHEHKAAKQTAKITTVSRNEESWDAPTSKNSSNLENLDAYIDVYVSAVEHPGHFWVQVIGTHALHLEQLQMDITHFASSGDAKTNFAVTEVTPGELVAARFEESDEVYYRAKIIGEVDGKVDLYFVDFGDNALAEKKDIFKLRSDFTKFPFQAIECILANVAPVGNKWSEEAITLFEDLSHCARWRTVLARVVTYKSVKGDQKTPVVQLFDRNGSQNIDIGAELVKQGLALSQNSTQMNGHSSKTNVSGLEKVSEFNAAATHTVSKTSIPGTPTIIEHS